MSLAQSRVSQPEWYRIAVRERSVILRGIRSLERSHSRESSIHRIRTSCRRFQALLELLGRQQDAQAVADAAGLLSKLRALQVFRRYLRSKRASRADLTLVKDRIRREIDRLTEKGTYPALARVITNHVVLSRDVIDPLLAARIPLVRDRQIERLRQTLDEALRRPRRKPLHALRLLLKQVRYQTEWLSRRQGSRTELVSRLKTVQTLLGRYEELADFKRWARKWDLRIAGRIRKEWKRARRRARAVPQSLSWLPDVLRSEAAWQTARAATTTCRIIRRTGPVLRPVTDTPRLEPSEFSPPLPDPQTSSD